MAKREGKNLDLKEIIRTIPDYPQPGILFRDITPLMSNGPAFEEAVRELSDPFKDKIDQVAGIEARGFVFGGAIAHRLGVGFIPLRKEGKLPHDRHSEAYDLEYGSATLEMHTDALGHDEEVLVVDDLIATGGTAIAAVNLLRRAGAEVTAACFAIDLPELGGTGRLRAIGVEVLTLMEFEGH